MIFIVLLIFVVLFVFIAKFGISYATKLTERMMTSRFQDANAILNEKAVPERWIKTVEKKIFRPSPIILLMNRFRDLPENRDVLAKEEIMLLLAKLTKYFERCPFFEDPDSKKMMLEELEGIRTVWEPKRWPEIVGSTAGA